MFHSRLDRLSIKLLPLEHRIWRELKSYGLKNQKIIVAVSGGLDSVVLATMMARLSALHKCEITLAHVHHGEGSNQKQRQFRNEAAKFVKNLAQELGVAFVTNKAQKNIRLTSEAELRDYRYKFLEKWARTKGKRNSKGTLMALAHHADDLLETQLLRLIRGVGGQGLRSMLFLDENKIRPLLHVRRGEIKEYAHTLKLNWIEDPSNRGTDPLRNWLRQRWLKDLEKKSPGATEAMMRSFSLLTQTIFSNTEAQKEWGAIQRQKFLALGRVEQCAWIARYLKSLKIKNYSHGHVEEIRRRLDNSREEYTFTLLKHVWQINAGRIQAAKI